MAHIRVDWNDERGLWGVYHDDACTSLWADLEEAENRMDRDIEYIEVEAEGAKSRIEDGRTGNEEWYFDALGSLASDDDFKAIESPDPETGLVHIYEMHLLQPDQDVFVPFEVLCRFVDYHRNINKGEDND